MKPLLERCPFCGGEAVQKQACGDYYVECRKCRISTRAYYKPGTSINQWNRRVNDIHAE